MIADQTQAVLKVIAATRCDLSDEKRAQEQLAEALGAAGLPFEREKRLSPRDVVDFLACEHIAVELKLKGAVKIHAFRQLERYAQHDQVRVLILATNLSMGLPADIGGKPAYYASLGRAWL